MGKVTKSSGNVFEDLGFDVLESANLKLRAQLMRELETLIHNERLTQIDAAELLGIQQSRVSDLVRGKVEDQGSYPAPPIHPILASIPRTQAKLS